MKISGTGLLLLVAIGVIAFLGFKNKALSNEVGDLQESIIFRDDSIVKLTEDLTAAKTTTQLTSAQKDTLAEELETIKRVNARLIAAASISLRPDTVYRDSVVVVEGTSGNNRTASVRDSTDLGVLTGLITVPPAAPIEFEYRFYPNPLNVDISLARTERNTAFFLFKYRGGETEVEYSYADLPRVEPRFSWYLQGGYYVGEAFAASIGANLRVIDSWYLSSFAEQKFTQQANSDTYEPVHLFVGLRKSF